MDMQTVYRKKVDRIRGWIARRTKNVVIYRSSCGVCSRERIVVGTVSDVELQGFIHRPGTLERRDATTIQCCSCGEGYCQNGLEGQASCEVWNDDTPKFRFLLPGTPNGIIGDAPRLGNRG